MDGEAVLGKIVAEFLSPMYKLAVGFAFLYFLYGVVKFIYNINDPEKKNLGKSHMLWGLIGLFIIFSVGGILQVLNSVLSGMFSF
jgi:hypothetical protein